MAEDKRVIIFFREGMFYPTEYPASYKDWQAEADRNPGTLKIMDGATGKVLWPPIALVPKAEG
jgi:hypothetical protein